MRDTDIIKASKTIHELLVEGVYPEAIIAILWDELMLEARECRERAKRRDKAHLEDFLLDRAKHMEGLAKKLEKLNLKSPV